MAKVAVTATRARVKKETDNDLLNERRYTHQTSSMGAAILENIVTRSEDSTLFREISREMSWHNAA